MEKKSNEIRTKHNKLHVGNRAELKGCPVAKVTHKKKDDYMTSLEFTEGVYNQPIKMVTIYFQDGSIRNETPLTEAKLDSHLYKYVGCQTCEDNEKRIYILSPTERCRTTNKVTSMSRSEMFM